MRFKIVYKISKTVDRILLPDAPMINRTLFAKALGVSRATGNNWLNTGKINPKFIPRLREIKLIEVVGRQGKGGCRAKR